MSLETSTVFKYNGAEYEFDFSDADNAEAYEKAIKQMEVDEKKLEKDGTAAALIRGQCAFLKKFFDEVLGAGAGEAVCGAKDNLLNCYEAYDAFLAFIRAQNQNIISRKNSFGKYSNREQRRHPAKSK